MKIIDFSVLVANRLGGGGVLYIPNCPKEVNKNPGPFLTHPRKTKELSETKASFLYLDILHLQQIFNLNIGIRLI